MSNLKNFLLFSSWFLNRVWLRSFWRTFTVDENHENCLIWIFTPKLTGFLVLLVLFEMFEFLCQKSTLVSKRTILMIFGAKIQIFKKLTFLAWKFKWDNFDDFYTLCSSLLVIVWRCTWENSLITKPRRN